MEDDSGISISISVAVGVRGDSGVSDGDSLDTGGAGKTVISGRSVVMSMSGTVSVSGSVSVVPSPWVGASITMFQWPTRSRERSGPVAVLLVLIGAILIIAEKKVEGTVT